MADAIPIFVVCDDCKGNGKHLYPAGTVILVDDIGTTTTEPRTLACRECMGTGATLAHITSKTLEGICDLYRESLIGAGSETRGLDEAAALTRAAMMQRAGR